MIPALTPGQTAYLHGVHVRITDRHPQPDGSDAFDVEHVDNRQTVFHAVPAAALISDRVRRDWRGGPNVYACTRHGFTPDGQCCERGAWMGVYPPDVEPTCGGCWASLLTHALGRGADDGAADPLCYECERKESARKVHNAAPVPALATVDAASGVATGRPGDMFGPVTLDTFAAVFGDSEPAALVTGTPAQLAALFYALGDRFDAIAEDN